MTPAGKQPTRPRVPRTARRGGFSLIEILIVVTILAILAGLVFPHYINHSESAKAASLVSDLQILRQQLMAYEIDHTVGYPKLAQMWDNMTGITDDAGNIIKYKKDGKRKGDKKKHAPGKHGPYFVEPPVNPFTGGSACAVDNTADWEYDENSGKLRVVVSADLIARLGLERTDVVAAP